jgi:hypothetical protein
MRLRNVELIGGLTFLILGALIVYGSVQLGIGSLTRPGPGFLSSGVGGMMVLLAIQTIFSGLRIDRMKVAPSATFPSPVAVVSLIGAMIAYGLFVDYAGFILCTFAFMLAMQIIGTGKIPGLRAVIVSAVVTAVIYFIFETLLRVGLPAGSWWG